MVIFLEIPKITTFLWLWRYRHQPFFVATEVSNSTTLAINRQIWKYCLVKFEIETERTRCLKCEWAQLGSLLKLPCLADLKLLDF